MRLISSILLLSALQLTACSSDKKFSGSAVAQADKKEPVEDTANQDPLPDEPTSVAEPEVEVPSTEEPAQLPDNVVATDTSIEFGADGIFHIGDGAFAASTSCAGEIGAVDLTGVTYFFEFEVVEDDTDVDLQIGKLCGADYNGNRLSLIRSNTKAKIKDLAIPKDSTGETQGGWEPFSTVNLAKGKYSVVVSSKKGSIGGGEVPGDFDDFLIGEINVKANKQVKAIRIFTE